MDCTLSDDDFEINVGDLESVSVTRGELERYRSSEWAKARRHFRALYEAQLAAKSAELESRLGLYLLAHNYQVSMTPRDASAINPNRAGSE